MEKVRNWLNSMFRRFFVLTSKYLLTFPDNQSYKNPTEVIEMSACTTVKSAEDETYKPNSFVSNYHIISFQKLEVNGWTFYMYADNSKKENEKERDQENKDEKE